MSGMAAVVANAAPSSGRGHKLRRYLPDAERRLVDSLGRGHPWHSGASCCTLRARSRLIECPPRQCGVFVPSRPWRQGSRTVCRSRSRLGFRTRCLPSGLAVAWLRGPTSTRPGGGYWGSRPSCINGRPTTLIVGSMTCSTSSSIPPSWWWRGIGCGGIGGHGPQESLRSSPADDCLDASAPWIMRTGRTAPDLQAQVPGDGFTVCDSEGNFWAFGTEGATTEHPSVRARVAPPPPTGRHHHCTSAGGRGPMPV